MSRPSITSRFRLEAFRQRRIADRGPQVGEQAEILAQPQQAGLGPHVVGDLVPLRPADRAEDHRVRRIRQRHGVLGDADLVRVIGGAADQTLFIFKARSARRVEPGDDLLHLAHHLGADAVAGQKQQFVGRHGRYALRLGVAADRPQRREFARIAKGPGGPWQDGQVYVLSTPHSQAVLDLVEDTEITQFLYF